MIQLTLKTFEKTIYKPTTTENYYFRSFLQYIQVNIKEGKMELSYNGMGEWERCYFQIPETSK